MSYQEHSVLPLRRKGIERRKQHECVSFSGNVSVWQGGKNKSALACSPWGDNQ